MVSDLNGIFSLRCKILDVYDIPSSDSYLRRMLEEERDSFTKITTIDLYIQFDGVDRCEYW